MLFQRILLLFSASMLFILLTHLLLTTFLPTIRNTPGYLLYMFSIFSKPLGIDYQERLK
jgi:hypothetical protein